MTRHNLLTITNLRTKAKTPGYHLDGRGLYLRVAPGGSQAWILRYTYLGRTRDMGLGSLADVSLARARERAQEHRIQIAEGIDPIQYREQKRIEIKATAIQLEQDSVTFKACAEEYHKEHAGDWKNAKHKDQWINTLTTYAFPHFGRLPIREVGKHEILKALTPIWREKAETADRLLQRIRKVLNYGAAKDYCRGVDGEFWAQVRIALGANEKARKVEHHPSCPHPQIGALLARVRASTATATVQMAFEFGVLTAARSGEIRGARWSEFDASLGNWTIPPERMKAGREHRVPLSNRATEVLQAARALQAEWEAEGSAAARGTDATDLVFPSPRGKTYSDMVFTQLLRRLEQPYTMHGFRATFRTWGMDNTQYPAEMLEFALAHLVGDQTVRAYARSDMVEKRRQLMEDWAAYIVGQAGEPFSE
ncbi:integrase arm-type DNA-binding domain-containing protein [Variovorax sp. ZS18.2.2]|uniref:tyrosine-type recombinase/integrase n=1 Tax=Variovorax sp. ZS18.2.2 TaxID=2971255 RepID=UPI00215132D3|nr:integrase arm-type DNA-binding domain-containing protein [Variovorax sp. ZS18.2.2]MCR6477808.1 integrase arm-type DNA-binding domain-containing protein [Variovorax sp. ZS18.2.2]